ncbi:MAG: cobalamin B12-binding domain-containing protein [Armatimonadetes bacterium]|nr:cobalamin B12-binding domain-containing protein [Armatimonadota bacterium]
MDSFKVLLINAPYSSIYGPLKIALGRYFPLGLGYIASVLRNKGYLVKLLDPEAQNLNDFTLNEEIKKFKPDLVGISCATPNFFQAQKIAKIVKENFTSPVVLGGVHASAIPEYILKNSPEIDFIVKGEGEETLLELINELKEKRNFSKVLGLVFKENNQIKVNPSRTFIQNLDSLPYPARDLVPFSLYRPHSHNFRKTPCVTMITSRGCPSRCTFCASYLTTGKVFRAHSSEYVISEIEFLVKNYGIKQVIFQDDTFTLKKERVAEICESLIKKNFKILWFCFARINTVDKELLILMKKAGCFSIGYGIESGDEIILKKMKKGLNLSEAEKILKLSNKLGFKTQAFFILGYIEEDFSQIKKTINLAKKLNPTLAFFNFLVPYPGTEVFDQFYKIEEIENWGDFVAIGQHPVSKISKLSKDELQKAIKLANREFYLRPSQIFHILKQIKSWHEFKEYFKGALGLFRQMRF